MTRIDRMLDQFECWWMDHSEEVGDTFVAVMSVLAFWLLFHLLAAFI